MTTATVKNISLDAESREIKIVVNAKDTMYVDEPKGFGQPILLNSGPLVEGLNILLESGHHAVGAMKNNTDFSDLMKENKELKSDIICSPLANRVRQFLSALDYASLSDFQAKCVLLLEKELKAV